MEVSRVMCEVVRRMEMENWTCYYLLYMPWSMDMVAASFFFHRWVEPKVLNLRLSLLAIEVCKSYEQL